MPRAGRAARSRPSVRPSRRRPAGRRGTSGRGRGRERGRSRPRAPIRGPLRAEPAPTTDGAGGPGTRGTAIGRAERACGSSSRAEGRAVRRARGRAAFGPAFRPPRNAWPCHCDNPVTVDHPRIHWLADPAILAPLVLLVVIYVRRLREARREGGGRGVT